MYGCIRSTFETYTFCTYVEQSSQLLKDQIRSFIQQIHEQLVNNCDVRRVSTRLHQLGAIASNDLERVGSLVPGGTANRALYEILVVDPDEKKLKHLSTALKEDTSRGNHKELAELIDKYLASRLFTRFGGYIHEIISKLCDCYDMDHCMVLYME